MAKTTTKFDVRNEAAKVFYAGVGVNDLAVEKVRGYVTGIDLDPKALRDALRTRIEERVAELQAGAKAYPARVQALPGKVQALPAKVQALLDENVDTATDAYGDLVKRGQTLVGRIRRQESTKATVTAARTTTSKAKTTGTQAGKAASAQATATKRAVKASSTTAKKKTSTAKSSAKATGTAATKTAQSAAKATTDAAAKVGD